MKLKDRLVIDGGWKEDRILLNYVETLWMTFLPLTCGILFGLYHNLWYLFFGILPIFVKFIYRRGTDKAIIYLR